MFRTDFEVETMPFVIEGQHTKVFGTGEVLGKLAIATEPRELLRNKKFDEPGTIPVLVDEFCMSEDWRMFEEITQRLGTGFWRGFVTFGSSEMIKTHRREGVPSHLIIALRGFGDTEGFISVIDNDERNDLSSDIGKAMLRGEIGMFEGMDSVLRAVSPTKATIELAGS